MADMCMSGEEGYPHTCHFGLNMTEEELDVVTLRRVAQTVAKLDRSSAKTPALPFVPIPQ